MGIVYNSFFPASKTIILVLHYSSLGEARPKVVLFLKFGFNSNIFSVGKMEIWPLHIHCTSSKTQFSSMHQGIDLSLLRQGS